MLEAVLRGLHEAKALVSDCHKIVNMATQTVHLADICDM